MTPDNYNGGGMKKESQEGVFAAIIRFLNNILEFFASRGRKQEEERKRQEIETAKVELKIALASGRVQDAAYWRRKLAILTSTLSMMLLFLMTGCVTPAPQPQITPVVVLGERINKVKPGQTVVVPPLVPPAKQWYLVDDHGLYQWLDIDLSLPKTKSTTQ